MYCKKCGAEMQEDAVFCPKCGAEVSQSTPKCDQESQDNNKQQQKGMRPKKPIQKQWWFWVIVGVIVLTVFISVLGGGDETGNQGDGSAASNNSSNSTLGYFDVVIESSRLATDYKGKPIVIVKYKFTNNGDEPASFMWSLQDRAFQNGVGLNECYVAADSANYSSDNQSKEIKKGASIYVEVAYELNDSVTDVNIEISELISFSDKKITKTFSID